MKLYNSLTKSIETFEPLESGQVKIYQCGPTVYDYVHVGNLRTFLMGDFVRRSLEFQGYHVTQVMNITDIGHLVSDGDDGEDKMTKALKREGKDITLENMLELADRYADAFKQNLNELNMLAPHELPKASQHIKESIEIVTSLENKGYTYVTSDGVYFETSKMENYGALGGVMTDPDQAEARISTNSEKRSPADFALWKFDAHQGWESPWGKGFPGWHIECSGMSMRYLGPQFDIHTGGSDLKNIHHNNEIAQSECASGNHPFVKYWMHGEMLNFNGEKLSKSTGGNITLQLVKDEGFMPLAYRYLALQTHYRSPMNFSWEILEAAQNGLVKVQRQIRQLQAKVTELPTSTENEYLASFKEKINDDINIPQALAVFHDTLKSELPDDEKLATLYVMDSILGLDLKNLESNIEETLPQEIQDLLVLRKTAREEKNWSQSDEIRDQLESLGYQVLDQQDGQVIVKI